MFTLRDDERVRVIVTAVDSHGHSAPVENVVIESSDPSILAIQAIAGVPHVVTQGVLTQPNAAVQIRVTCDARIGEGIVELSGEESVEVVSGEAKTMSISFGAPEPA